MVPVSFTIDFDWLSNINPLNTRLDSISMGMEWVYILIASQNQSYN